MKLVLFILFLSIAPVRAGPLSVDLSSQLVSVTTDFKGDKIVLFGAKTGTGDIVVTIRGPEENIIVKRKVRTAGFWIDRETAIFPKMPSYYSMVTSASLKLPKSLRQKHHLGIDSLNPVMKDSLPMAEKYLFLKALIRHKQHQKLYRPKTKNISYLGNGLFKSMIKIPRNAPIGTYQIDVFLIQNAQVKDQKTLSLFVKKSGFNQKISDFARHYAALYAMLALMIAAFFGWAANALFANKH